MSELFYRQSDYQSFKPRKVNYAQPIFTQYADLTPQPEPSFGETFSAHLAYQWTPITRFIQEQKEFTEIEDDDNFMWQDQPETLDHASFANTLSRAKNRRHYDYLLEGIKESVDYRDTMDRGGLFPALVAGIADPLNIAFALPVFNVGLRSAWAANSVFGVAKEGAKIGFGFGVASETLRAPFDPLNTPEEIALNVTSSTVMSSLLTGGMKGITKGFINAKGKYQSRGTATQVKEQPATSTVEVDISGTEQAIKNIEDRLPILKQLMFRGKYTQEEGFQYVAELKSLTDDLKKFRKILKDAKNDKPVEVQKQSIIDLPDTEIQARYGKEFNINKVVTDPNIVKQMKVDENKPNVLGTHIIKDGEGVVYVDTERATAKFKRLKQKAKDKIKGWAELEQYKDAGVPYAHTRFMFDNIDSFKNEKDFIDFVLLHEMHHGKVPIKAKESPVDYEMRINDLALKRMIDERNNAISVNTLNNQSSTNMGGTKDTAYQRFGFVSKFIPARIINESSDVNIKIKDDYNKMAYNASVALQGNQEGKGVQSLQAKARSHSGKAYVLRRKLRQKWMMQTTGRTGTGQVLGVDITSMGVKKDRFLYGKNKSKTYDEWFTDLVNIHIMNGNPAWRDVNYKLLDDVTKEALDDVESLLRSADVEARDVGVLGDDIALKKRVAGYKEDIIKLDERLALHEAKEKSIRSNAQARGDSAGSKGSPIFTKIQDRELKRIAFDKDRINTKRKDYETQILWSEGVLKSPTRKDYKWPIYYDKAMLLNNPDKIEDLTKIFADHFSEQGRFERWNDVDGKWETIQISGSRERAREEAEKVISKILELGDDAHSMTPKSGKGKHLMMRATNIPEWKVKDFIIKDERVLENYLEKMGFRIEWARTFGRSDIEDLLDEHQNIMKADGVSDKRIAEIRTLFLADYEREAGQMIRSPDRWDNKYSRLGKKLGGMTYLTGAGVTSIIETVAMPIFEHGLGRVFRSAVMAVDGSFADMKANARSIQYANEGIELQKPIAQQQFLTDSIRDVQPGKLERTLEAMEKGFYIGNGLSIITSLGKHFDAAIRIPKFYEQITKFVDGSGTAFDEEELFRYGINKQLAKDILTMPWEKSQSGMPLINIANWPEATTAERAVKRSMLTYLGTASRNTIMHATAFDKPTIMDGFVYVKWKPWMSKLGISVDERASIKVGKTITYPMARIESGIMALPFQFYNFAFAATNRILAASLDPSRQYRLQGAMALMGMSYITLQLKKPDWWFENKDMPELMMRSFEMSGIMGVYSDIAYHALHSAIATGLHDQENSWLKGKYNPTVGDQFADFAGATPGMLREWTLGAHELLTNQTEEGLKRLSYNLPIIGLTPFAEDMRMFGKAEKIRQ